MRMRGLDELPVFWSLGIVFDNQLNGWDFTHAFCGSEFDRDAAQRPHLITRRGSKGLKFDGTLSTTSKTNYSRWNIDSRKDSAITDYHTRVVDNGAVLQRTDGT